MRYTDPEEPVSYTDCKATSSLDLTFDQGEPHIFTGEHCLKALILCMESHWHKPVSQIKTLLYHLKPCFKMDSSCCLIPQPTELNQDWKGHFKNPHLPTTQLGQVPLERVFSNSAAVLEVRARWADFISHPSTFGKEVWKGWKTETFCLCLFASMRTVGISKSFILLKLPVATSNQSLADDNKMSTEQIRLQGTVMCTAEFSAVCRAIPHSEGIKKLKKWLIKLRKEVTDKMNVTLQRPFLLLPPPQMSSKTDASNSNNFQSRH